MISGVQSRTKPKPGVRINPAHPLSKGLVGYWLFNEGAGSVANDISGHGNHGTLPNMSPNAQDSGWGASKFGGGLAFDGTNDRVDCGNDKSFDITDAITISVWLNTNVLNIFSRIVHKNGAYALFINSTDSCMRFHNYGTGYGVSADTGCLSTDTWLHVVVTKDSINGVTFFVDGIGSGTDSTPDARGNLGVSTVNLYIGIDEDLSSYPFNGAMDNVSIYNRALSAAEVKQLYEDPFCNLLSPRRWYVPAAGPSGVIMNQFQTTNIGADLFNGGLQ